MPWKESNYMDQRVEFVLKSFYKNVSFKQLCRDYGIAQKTGYKWKSRFIQNGIRGLNDLSKKPKSSPNQINEESVCEIIRLKNEHKTWGPKKLQCLFSKLNTKLKTPSISTFNRILKKSGFIIKKKVRPVHDSERIEYKIMPKHPNDLWTVDFKGWWYTSKKEKCEPLTVRDDYSKYILALKYVKSSEIDIIKAEFEYLFKKFGLPKVIQSDNGTPFASSNSIFGLTNLSVWWLSLGIKLNRIFPGKPYQNGAHERMHKDIKLELQGKINGDVRSYQAAFDIWKDEFNTVRPHEALNMKTPASVYKVSDIPFPEDNIIIDYPDGFISRLVNDRGCICFNNRKIFISNAFFGFQLGLKVNSNTTMEVWFDNLFLGIADLVSYSFKSEKPVVDSCNNFKKVLPMS